MNFPPPPDLLQRATPCPWGEQMIWGSVGFLTFKYMSVRPGASLSLQFHYGRDEYWYCIGGCGYITLGRRKFPVRSGSYAFIPSGMPHSIFNAGEQHLRIIEIQCGVLRGEHDIVRLSDIYGRAPTITCLSSFKDTA